MIDLINQIHHSKLADTIQTNVSTIKFNNTEELVCAVVYRAIKSIVYVVKVAKLNLIGCKKQHLIKTQ